jgi:hypothetical protein
MDSIIKNVGLKVISSKLKQLIPYADDVAVMARTKELLLNFLII